MKQASEPLIYLEPKTLEQVSDYIQIKKEQGGEDSMSQQPDANDELYKSDLLKCMVRKFVDKLPKTERKVVRLRFWENQNFEEISSRMKISQERAHEVLESALSHLRAMLIASLAAQKKSEEKKMTKGEDRNSEGANFSTQDLA